MNQRHDQFDASLLILGAAMIILIGAGIGWYSRYLSVNDQLLMATIAKQNAQKDYYDAELAKTLGVATVAQKGTTNGKQTDKN